jgi:hypothetical protein
MALTKTQVSELYTAIFNRASEGDGNAYWAGLNASAATIAQGMLDTTDAATYFGTSLATDQAFVEHIYLNTLNKTVTDDAAGIAYWVSLLDGTADGTMHTRGEVVSGLVSAVASYSTSTDPATIIAYNQFTNRVAVSDYTADTVATAPTDYATSLSYSGSLTVTNDAATVTTAQTAVVAIATTEDAAKTITYTIAPAAASVTEGNAIVFTLTASEAKSVTATTLNYQITGVEVAGGTATPADDLGNVTGTVTIAAGATTGTITLTPTNDGVIEGYEGFKVTVLDSAFATVATSSNVVISDGASSGTTQSLLTTTDNLTGTSGDDTFNSVAIVPTTTSGTTLSAGDTIAAGDGIDTLNISVSGTSTAASTIQAFQASGLEKILVSNFDTGATESWTQTIDTTLVTGLTTIGLSSSGSLGDTVFTGMNSLVAAEMKNGAGDLTLTYNATPIAGTTDTQALTVSNVSAGTFITSGVETVAVTTELAASTLTNIFGATTSTSPAKITVAGSQNLTVTGAITSATVDASTMTGALTMLAGAGNQTITGGTGNDVIDMSTNLTIADVINGGAGTDTLKLSVGSDTIDATAVTGELIGVTNVENIQINSTGTAVLDLNGYSGVTTVEAAANVKTITIATAGDGADADVWTGTLNGVNFTAAAADSSGNQVADQTDAATKIAAAIDALSGFTATSSVNVVTVTSTTGEAVELSNINDSITTDNATATISAYTGNVSFTNLAAGVALDIYSGDSVTYSLKDASGLTDSATVNLKTTTADKGFSHTTGTLVINEVETLNLDSSGLVNSATAYSANTLSTLSSDSKLTTLNVTGDTNLTITTMTSPTKLATINASTFTGDLSIAGTNVALNQTITTGSGNDTIAMGAFLTNADVINGGSNTAVIATGAAGADTLTATVTSATATTGAFNISNVERINLTNAGTAIVNAAGITGATEIAVLTNTTQTTISNLAAGTAVGVGIRDTDGDTDGILVLSLADETGTADSLTVNFNDTATANTNTVNLKGTAIENYTFNFGTDTGTTKDSSLAKTALTVSSLNASKITVAGATYDVAHTLSLGTLDTETVTLDASTYAGILTATASTSATNVTVKGGVLHVLAGNASNDTFTVTAGSANADVSIDGAGGTGDTLTYNLVAGAADLDSIANIETLNLVIANSAAVTMNAADSADGLQGSTSTTITGGNSLSSLTIGATDALTTTTMKTLDASAFAGTVALTFVTDAIGAGVTVKGGVSTTDAITTLYSADATIASMTGIETLNLSAFNADININMVNVTGLTKVAVLDASNDDLVLTDLATGVTIDWTSQATTSTLTIDLVDKATNTANTQTVNLLAGAAAGGILVATDIETLTIDNAKAGAALDLSGLSMTTALETSKLVMTGAVATTISSLNADVTIIDASAMTAGLTVSAISATTAMTVTGGSGDDSLLHNNTSDVINAGDGTSDTLTVSFQAIGKSIDVDLSKATGVDMISVGGVAGTVQSDFENITLTNFVGTGSNITGSTGANTIIGSGYTDAITAGEGIDSITGGAGQDYITLTESTAVADTVIFNGAFSAGVLTADTITGYAAADLLDIQFNLANGGTAATSALVALTPVAGAADSTATINDVIFTLGGAGDQMATGTTIDTAIANAVTALTSGADFSSANITTADSLIIALDDGVNTFVYHYVADGTAGTTAAADLELICVLNGMTDANTLVVGDFI